jgi:integrase
MTPAGFRSLFRHHRKTTGIQLANPHRFRHTFASDMVRAGRSCCIVMAPDKTAKIAFSISNRFCHATHE